MKTILVVDDEPMVLRGITLVLEQSHLDIDRILTAENGVEALYSVDKNRPDLVITDIRMPKLDGMELTRIISEQYPETDVIIVSGYNDFSYAKKAIQYGVKDYILKPIQRTELIQSVSSVIFQSAQDHVLYIAPRELDEILVLLVNWFWLQNEEYLELGVERLSQLLQTVPFSCRQVLTGDIAESLISKISLKMGCSLEAVLFEFSGSDSDDLIGQFELFLKAISRQLKNQEEEDYNQVLLKMARTYVEEHYQEEISLNEIAAKTGFSSSYFSQLFKERVGCSFVQYRTKLRLEKAKEMIAAGRKSITDIAMRTGYNDTSYFIRAFKEYTGVTPKQYKKSMNREDRADETVEE